MRACHSLRERDACRAMINSWTSASDSCFAFMGQTRPSTLITKSRLHILCVPRGGSRYRQNHGLKSGCGFPARSRRSGGFAHHSKYPLSRRSVSKSGPFGIHPFAGDGARRRLTYQNNRITLCQNSKFLLHQNNNILRKQIRKSESQHALDANGVVLLIVRGHIQAQALGQAVAQLHLILGSVKHRIHRARGARAECANEGRINVRAG
jgi:hypothetical protein